MKLLQIDGEGKIVAEYNNPAEAAKETGLDASHIVKVLKGKRTSHGGFRWKYEEGTAESDDFMESRSSDYKDGEAVLTAKTEKSIQSLEEAIEFFDVDVSIWDVERFLVNSWDVTSRVGKRTNYQVKVWLKRKEPGIDEIFAKIKDSLKGHIARPIPVVSKSFGTITVELADFHIGADVRDMTRSPDFNLKTIADYFAGIVDIVNRYGAESVVYNMHGDFIESFTGLNHDDSWKSLVSDMYGANVLMVASELLSGRLISKTNNVKEVNLVSGNHDRISRSSKVDGYGETAKILAWLLRKDFPEVRVNHNHLVLVREIDGINHIMTHGHHGISKKDVAKVVADYGDSNKFNLWTEGHIHSRVSTKVIKSKISKYETIEYVTHDDQKYRKIVLPSLFTGNFYSESLGFSSSGAGFIVTFNNGRGIPNIHDYTL